jgi:NADH-quinone oxidoreductase subunit I
MIAGVGVVKTLAIALGQFVMTYVADVRAWIDRLRGVPASSTYHSGALTIRYPYERPAIPETYRNTPFLIIDAETSRLRCIACGVCAQICPVQCIWIERATDPETGRPRRHPVSFYVDVSLCMACGMCAEFCPFEAIKMDHAYELACYQRPGFVSARDLAKPEAYDMEIHRSDYAVGDVVAGPEKPSVD